MMHMTNQEINDKVNDPHTFEVYAEYTDTFGGEPNYCWVERRTITFKSDATDLQVMRRLKREFGLNGVRGVGYATGLGKWGFRPYRSCTIMMAQVNYE